MVVFASIVMLIVLSSAIFALQSVEVEFSQEVSNLEGKQQEIVEAGDFAYGTNVLFLKKSPYIDKLEKQFPYLKILNIETCFPNRLVIHAEERQELFTVKLDDNLYVVIDEDYKILRKINVSGTFVSTPTNPILLSGVKFSGGKNEGDFLQIDSSQESLMLNVLVGCKQWNLENDFLKSKIEQIYIDYEKQSDVLIKMHTGVQILLKNASVGCETMLNLAFSAYDYSSEYRNQGTMEVRIIDGQAKIFFKKTSN